MSNDELLIDANRKWLAARGVTDWRTLGNAKRRAARAAVRKLDAFMLVFDEFEMLDCLTPDGEHRQQHDADEATQMRKKLCRVFGYLERGVA